MRRILPTIIKQLNSVSKKYIYGAGDVAREVYFCLSNEPYCFSIEAFIVSDIKREKTIGIKSVPVISCEDKRIDKTALVIVAVLEKYKAEICKKLDEMDMANRVFMTFESDMWSEVREETFKCFSRKMSYSFIFSDKEMITQKDMDAHIQKDLCVYVTRSSKDKPLIQSRLTKEWEREIVAGAAIDKIKGHFITDDKGDNISLKNRKYCELTAMYWIWKNTESAYIGLSHYRRRFNEDDIALITEKNVECMLTIPMINVPNVLYMYGKNHDAKDWQILRNIVDGISPKYTRSLEVVEASNYYVPYNMFVMKRNVFNQYCEWIFPILEECEKTIGDKADLYQNRYIGFLAERLMTAYFYHHKDDLRILFCNKAFLE